MSSKRRPSEPGVAPNLEDAAPQKRRRTFTERAALAGPDSPTLQILIVLPSDDAKGLAAAAQETGLSPNAWIAALVRRRLRGKPTLFSHDATILPDILAALRRLTTNLREMRRAADLSDECVALAEVERLRRDIRQQMAHLRQALIGNLSHWQVDP